MNKFIIISIIAVLFIGCKSDKGKPEYYTKATNEALQPIKDIGTASKLATTTKGGLIINIVDTLSTEGTVIIMADSASTIERMQMKIKNMLSGKIAECMKVNVLKQMGSTMVWCRKPKAPYFFEAGVPVSAKPYTQIPGVYVKQVFGDSVLIAHCYGPKANLEIGYEALAERVKFMGRSNKGLPYEIYVNDNVTEDNKIQTDIIMGRTNAPIVKEPKVNKSLFAKKGAKDPNDENATKGKRNRSSKKTTTTTKRTTPKPPAIKP